MNENEKEKILSNLSDIIKRFTVINTNLFDLKTNIDTNLGFAGIKMLFDIIQNEFRGLNTHIKILDRNLNGLHKRIEMGMNRGIK